MCVSVAGWGPSRGFFQAKLESYRGTGKEAVGKRRSPCCGKTLVTPESLQPNDERTTVIERGYELLGAPFCAAWPVSERAKVLEPGQRFWVGGGVLSSLSPQSPFPAPSFLPLSSAAFTLVYLQLLVSLTQNLPFPPPPRFRFHFQLHRLR